MHRRLVRLACATLLALAAPATPAQPAPPELRATFDAGSRVLALLWASGPPIDELRLIVPPRLAERLRAVDFPEGWFLRREAGSLTLAGPPAAPPVRFRVEVAEGAAPRAVAVEVRRGERPIFAADDLPVAPAPAPAADLAGLLLLPPVVSPGERVLVQVLDPRRTPPEGTWRIAGAAATPWDPAVSAFDPERSRRIEIETAAGAWDRAPRAEELARLAAALAAEDARGRGGRYVVEPLTADDVDPGAAIEDEEFEIEELPLDEEVEEALGEEGAAMEVTEEPEEEEAQEVVEPPAAPAARRGLEQAIAWSVVPVDAGPFGLADDPGAAVFAVSPRQGAELLADVGPGDEGLRLYQVTPAASAGADRIFAVAAAGAPGDAPPRFLAAIPAGGRGVAFEVAPVERLPPPPPPQLVASLLVADLPLDLEEEAQAEAQVEVTYGDPAGEITVEVPSAEVVIVPAGRREGPPRLDAAGGYALVGSPLCLCGRFPSPRAWRGLTLDGAPAAPIAASGWSAWLPVPPDLPPGRHEVAGLPALGFPAGRALAFDAVTVEVIPPDAALLAAGEPAPLTVRLRGTEAPLPIRLHNRTPERATLDDGDRQTVTTSGGPANEAAVTVRPRRRGGAPDVAWELSPAPCPCAD